MGYSLINILTFLLLFIGIFYFFAKNDEFPLLLPLFLFATGVYRYKAVVFGPARWVHVVYAIDIFDLNNDLALEALNLFFFGTALFFFGYMFYSNNFRRSQTKIDSQGLLVEFLNQRKFLIIGLFFFFLLVNSYTKAAMRGVQGMAFGMSYFFLFGMAIAGIILLAILLYRNVSLTDNSFLKIGILAIIIIAAIMSYDATKRFNFVSWMIASGILLVKDMSPFKKARLYGIAGIVALTMFLMAGNMRHAWTHKLNFKEKLELAWYRLQIAEDQNMLDGFMMVLNVYPEHLDYHLGGEHFEILLRPIPRAIWKNKPVGGYANKLGLNSVMKGNTVGISQTLYGSFYGEGGIFGIVFFCFLYGYFFVWLFSLADKYESELKYLIRGVIFASIIPLLRGGDLPGIVAFIGMSFWPVFGFIYLYNKFLKQKKFEEYQRKKAELRKKRIALMEQAR